MATIVNFGGKKIIEPGVYAQVKSGIPAQPSTFSFGNVCIIDTGSGEGYGGGSGIKGQLADGLGSVYSFQDVNDFQEFVRGGLLYDLAQYIFTPASGASGPETVHIVRACETTPAEIEFTYLGGGGNGGYVKILTKNEGAGSNGLLDETVAKGKIDFLAPITIGDTVDVLVGGTSILSGVFTTTTASAADLRAAIIADINSAGSGFTAYEQGGEVIVVSTPGVGSGGNSFVLTTALTGTVTSTITGFSGGVDGVQLATGYGARMLQGENDPTKFMIEFYEGTYRGLSMAGNEISGLTTSQSAPNLIATSLEFDNIDELIQWCKTDFAFSARFELDSDSWQINGTGAVDSVDLTNYSSPNLAQNGATDYAADDLDATLEAIKELDNTFFLADRWGADAAGTQNTKIWNHIQNDAEMDKFMIVGGGKDITKFEGSPDSSIDVAKYYDSSDVTVVHSGVKRPIIGNGVGLEKLDAIYHAANVVGRLGGLEPQTPITFKNLIWTDFIHPLGQKEREKALQGGVLHNRFVPGIGNVVNQGINSLQRNTQLINPDGTSFEISVMRIAAQLNKELILNMRPLFIGNNIGTITPADVKSFVESYLISRTATDSTDNLIINFKNVTVRLIQDYYDVKYGYVPNGPINKIFVTGFMLDANLSA